MSECAVEGCNSSSQKNPNMCFFDIPSKEHPYLRERWMKVLSSNKSLSESTKVCELHFSQLDFNTRVKGKKVLKTRAVPSVDHYESEDADESTHCETDSDPEIVEIKSSSTTTRANVKIKTEVEDDTTPDIKQERPPTPVEVETGRRPSRRAAQVAAKKIQDTVRSFSLNTEEAVASLQLMQQESAENASLKRPPPSPKAPIPRKRERRSWHLIRAPQEQIDLSMECHEELLSAVQAEALLKAQAEYNSVMKRLRALKASYARIICIEGDDADDYIHHLPKPSGTVIGNKTCNIVTVTPANNSVTIVPVHLVTVQSPTSGAKLTSQTVTTDEVL